MTPSSAPPPAVAKGAGAPGQSPLPGWSPVALTVRTDAGHGGRWTSLSTVGREWLWHHPDPAVSQDRGRARPGTAFVDAGGVEECLPTIHGLPDHGAVWSMPWDSHGGVDSVHAADLSLRRTITDDSGTVSVAYVIGGPPGTPFVHAVHALLDLGPTARLVVPASPSAIVLDHDGRGGEAVSWPPVIAGIPADQLGPADGTAVAVLVPGCQDVVVIDGADALGFRWRLLDAAENPCSLLVWRNLGGWPVAGPYRSIGVEPLVGRTTTVRRGAPGQPAVAGAVRIPPTAAVSWQLEITAWQFSP